MQLSLGKFPAAWKAGVELTVPFNTRSSEGKSSEFVSTAGFF
jgi:hypothetical protein